MPGLSSAAEELAQCKLLLNPTYLLALLLALAVKSEHGTGDAIYHGGFHANLFVPATSKSKCDSSTLPV